jgi:hypothetical protein
VSKAKEPIAPDAAVRALDSGTRFDLTDIELALKD